MAKSRLEGFPANGAVPVPAPEVVPAWETALPGPPVPESAEAAADELLRADYPVLHAMLTRTVRSDGAQRQVCSLTLFAEGGQWKACLHERDADVSLWATGSCLGDLWGVLEARLTSGRPEWRRPKQPKSRR